MVCVNLIIQVQTVVQDEKNSTGYNRCVAMVSI